MSKRCNKNDAPTMNGCRSRNSGNGQLRTKRGDTHVRTIEERYGIDLGMRSNAHLETALKRFGVSSLRQLVEAARKQ
jgi:hypothetical protein